MRLVWIIVLFVILFGLASLAAIYSYGRFVERSRGTPSMALPVAEGDTSLDRLIVPKLQAHAGQSGLMLVASNLQAFAIRAMAARSAERSLDVQYYYWKDDLTGGLLARELIAAADRGVRVRLLLDDINTKGDDSTYLAIDSHPGIEVRLFNPSRSRTNVLQRGVEMALRAFSVTRRMHNKAWITDGRMAVVGGRNIGDAYFDAADTANFRDMDLLLLGPVVQQAETVFDEYWNSGAVLPITSLSKARKGDLAKTRAKLEALLSSGDAQPYLQRLHEEKGTEAVLSRQQAIHWTADARIVADPAEKARGSGAESWLANTIFPIIAAATRELHIISPYFIPGDQGVATLRNLAGAGADVSVLTNSLAATDVAAVHGAYARYREPLLAGGVDLYELRPRMVGGDISLFGSSGASLHTKAFTVDGKSGFIGSFNFDPRSISLNTEMGVLFGDPALTQEVNAVFADEISPASSYRLSLQDGAIAWQDGEGPEAKMLVREPEAGIWRRIAATVIGWLPIESQL
ncbi:phospholipase D family protein [Shinella daejeonensis]|uniref:phospholipase D family protein n=1 Tax=Shinella daejeonensis TaxID=659017 RepID=UPI0020C78D99|nr:phospholipase D family protein [Shinella daejeonensis]MCP8895290.1 phospholipase D family protein [Shinella daejeonensis]